MKTTKKREFRGIGLKSVDHVTHQVQSLLKVAERLKLTEDQISLIVSERKPRELVPLDVVLQRHHGNDDWKHRCLDHRYLLIQEKGAETYKNQE